MIDNPKLRVLIAIPTYNCENQITRTLDEIDNKLIKRVQEVAIIDNGSTDNTLEAALYYKESGRLGTKLHIYQNIHNYSLGGTHKVAFLKAKAYNCTHVIILHGDNQAKSDEANLLLDFAEQHPETQTVLGSRFSKESRLVGYDIKRIFGNKVLNAIYSVMTLKKCSDLGSGLNLFYVKDLEQKTYLGFADKLTFNYELLLDLIRRKVNFAYQPITWREEDQITNARNFNIFKTGLVNLIKWRFGFDTKKTKTSNGYKCKEII